MNRENKFRGKRLENGKWVYGDLLHPITSYRIVNYTEIKQYGIRGANYHYYDVDPSTVGQCTGMKDKNGTDIYEWDIVRSPRYKDPVVVCFTEGCFAVCDPNCCETCGRFATGIENLADAIILSNRELEVTGNIHDTSPELLKNQNNIKKHDMETNQDREYTLNDYQIRAMSTCMPSCDNFTYMLTELNAEVGEINDKIAKWRRKGIASIKYNELVFSTSELDEVRDYRTELAYELGDVLWAIAGLARTLGFYLETIGQMNIQKLADRKKRGVIDGSGDKR